MSDTREAGPGRGIRWKRTGNGSRSRRGARVGAAAVAAASLLTFSNTPESHAAGTTPIDTGTLSAISQITGAQAMWDRGFTGQGIGVAVIDTGVARVPGLNAPGKVIDGPDLSFDSQNSATAYTDGFGHGTHIAGIIAGSDVLAEGANKGCATCTGSSAYTDTTKFVGIAPGAKIVNVKVGAYDGAVDVTQVIAAIAWVVQHRNDPGLNIRVLNLSFGTDSLQPAQIDPLAYAVEVAWKAGIVVVAAAGNDGDAPGPLADPAYSPSVIAVGTTDAMGTLSTSDDVVASFAQHGTPDRPVDVAAPGVSVASLAVPGSFIDQNVTTGKLGTRFQRASGTSQSTAVVSGLAALILSKYPTALPDAVKTYLKAVTTGIGPDGSNFSSKKSGNKQDDYEGAGSANVLQVATSDVFEKLKWMKTILPIPTTGTGTGTIEGSRGSYHVTINGVPLAGEIDIFGRPINTFLLAVATSTMTSWVGGLWNGSMWTGAMWSGARWSSTAWTGSDWTGARWSGARWSDAVWDGARWSGARWSGARWSAGSWTGARWSGARWSGNTWS